MKAGESPVLSDNVLIVFVKYPQEGFVKTRLAEGIGRKNAARLHRLFTEAVLTRTKDGNFARAIFYSPVSKRNHMKKWLGDDLALYPQKGKDLGQRLSSAFRSVFRNGARRAVVIGTDCPGLDKGLVLDAFKRLKDTQCVLGPTFDGGYYLLGLSSFYEEIFQDIDWSSNRVFRQTLGKIKKSRISFSLLDKQLDIDNKDDLDDFCRRLPGLHKAVPSGLAPLVNFINRRQDNNQAEPDAGFPSAHNDARRVRGGDYFLLPEALPGKNHRGGRKRGMRHPESL